MHISRSPQINAPAAAIAFGGSVQAGPEAKKCEMSWQSVVGWGLFLGACVASVYFMYTGDVQRVLTKIEDMGTPGVSQPASALSRSCSFVFSFSRRPVLACPA